MHLLPVPRVVRHVAVLLVAAAAVMIGGPATADDSDATWGVRTAENDQGAGRENFRYEVDPGGTLDDAIVVTNHGDTALDLSIYAADGFTTDSGELDVGTADDGATSVGAWLTLTESHLTVPAGESVEVPFTVSIPDDAVPGDHAGAVVTSLTSPDRSTGISVDRRLGIRVFARVSGELSPALTVQDAQVSYQGTANPFALGSATVTYTVVNTGNTRLSGEQLVRVAGPFGWFRTDVPADGLPDLLPGESRTVRVSVPGVVPAFLLSATAEVEPTSPVGDTAAAGLEPVTVAMTAAAIPWSQLALLAVIAAGVVGGVLLVRRAGRHRQAHEAQRVAEAVTLALRERDEQPVGAPEA